jgi:mono/diheme cytochrome c family protein
LRRKAGAVLLLLIATACVGRPAEDATGEEIYAQLCANCHGADLQGGLGPALGPGTEAAAATDEFLLVTIHDGRGRMPSFSSSLDTDQLNRLVQYLRDVQGS